MSKDIGNEIKKIRLQKGYTQSELARMLFVSPQALSKWEKNETSPSLEMISNICEILDITPNDLFGYVQETVTGTIPKREIIHSNIKTFLLTITLYVSGVAIIYVGDMYLQVYPYNWILSIALWVFTILRMIFLLLNDIKYMKTNMPTKSEILIIFNNIFFTVLLFPFLIIYLFMDTVQMIGQSVSWSIWYSQHIVTLLILFIAVSIYVVFNITVNKRFKNLQISNKKSRN